MHQHYQACIEACERCANACDHCATSCLAEENVAQMANCVRLDMDCAQVCRLAVAAMSRGSDFAAQICDLCADICEACANECSHHDNEHCRACAAACKECAEICRQMSKAPQASRKMSSAGAHAH